MKKDKTGLLFIAPWLFGICVYKIYPFIASFVLSFTQYNIVGSPKFIGFDNYIKLFTKDTLFLKSLFVTIRYVVISVPINLIVALIVAMVMNSKLKGISLYRTVYYIPSILGGNIAIMILWKFLFSNTGLINQIIGGLGGSPISWFSSEYGTLFVIVLLHVWQFGSAMLIFLAALKEVPQELYEAAEMDGASYFKKFLNITIPSISPIIFFNLVMGLIGALQEFNAPYMLTKGGPLQTTYFIGLYIYDNAYRLFNMGYASALSWVLFVIIMTLTAIIFKSSSYWVFYSDGGKD
ncbi:MULTISPECIES: sugar ABC transporter permease [unclassified Enterococcus]|uniref:carbohydrate ABC transporter permease n=1 Tax=unclassified Enterococcus TaxID=2608891 RepID=UPI001555E0C9|nr:MULTISPECIES: sugar ABC transporter permease [unclassified Enterococcus]MBS7578158.1 sugar ABC transporter permease [Enterococcus sp. MMGLQ5-2]MBS7584026.1 sugar ABC transporter permease [Enterococcus sp. MMGLQ5-1]NPD11887.1 sugar ABC transporter permease [Enterococcus sp. MMGLQ5-1]NPD37989.1 sugar ABC transporter permease [Enterococcus sp. MMGLQ5-2]